MWSGIAYVEQIIDSDCRHLNVGIFGRERVAPEHRERGRNNKGPVAQTKIIVLESDRPIVCKCPLDASAHQPAGIGAAVGKGDRRTTIYQGKIAAPDPTTTALGINQDSIKCVAGASGYRRYPLVVANQLESLGPPPPAGVKVTALLMWWFAA